MLKLSCLSSSALLLTAGLATGLAHAQAFTATDDSGPARPPKAPVMFDLTSIDKTADPCTDFYQYACGNWIKNNPIPPTETRWGSFNTLSEHNAYLLWQDLKAAADAPKTPLQVKYGNYYAACMNTELIDKLGVKPIEPEMAMIAALKDKKKLAELSVEFAHRDGGQVLLGVGVGQDQMDSSKQILQTGQGGLTLPDRDYYLSDEPRMAKIREQYVEHMKRMFVLLGDTPETAATEAASVMKMETAFAQGSMSRVQMRDPAARYHIKTIAEVQALTPDFDWHVYLAGMGLGSAETMNVASPQFFETVNRELETESLETVKSYLRWHQLHGAAGNLAKPFADENFDFFNRTLNGQKEQQPRWKRCTRVTDGALGEAVGQDWVKQNFPPEAKANMEKLVAALEKALGEDIQSLPWMSDATKHEAELKLAAFRDKIGYPAHWRDYSALVVKRDDYLGNLERNAVFERNRNLKKLGQPVDETEWSMTPPTVNAYYNPPMNDINFPAGILQPPFYDVTKDPAINFGGIGMVIGHEMTHGFDDTGAKYGPTGNVKNWFTAEDKAKFEERTKCIADEYSGFEVAEGQKLNGKLTLGENSADNGGIRIAFQALQEVMARQGLSQNADQSGYTADQRFFVSFGQLWCSNATEQAARTLARTDTHSADKWRVNGTVQNFDQFGKAFGCKVGQPMMPEKSCRVW